MFAVVILHGGISKAILGSTGPDLGGSITKRQPFKSMFQQPTFLAFLLCLPLDSVRPTFGIIEVRNKCKI